MPKPENEVHNKLRETGLHNGPIRYLIKHMSSIQTSQPLIGSTSGFLKTLFGPILSKPDIAGAYLPHLSTLPLTISFIHQ